MEYSEAKNTIVRVSAELAEIESEMNKINNIIMEQSNKFDACKNVKKDLLNEIFESVQNIEGFDTLLETELLAISKGMDRTDYSTYGNFPRWCDLERLVTDVINFKKMYPGWILEYLEPGGRICPPRTSYKFQYKTPQGHYMSTGGFERVYNS